MAEIAPLRGLRYDPVKVGDMTDVVAPPYDVISPADQAALHDRSPYNVVRLILPREADRGAAAARTLGQWIEERALVRDDVPAIYPYTQTFALHDGRTITREGVICRLKLEDFASGIVRPHEKTLPGPKKDRLALLRATGALLSCIFGLYARPGVRLRDALGAVMDAPPLVDAVGSAGERHRLWRVTDPATIAAVAAQIAPSPVIIADGHHRYETALAYRDERQGASPYVLAFLTNMEEEGLVILPTHRIVPRALPMSAGALEAALRECFDVTTLDPSMPRPAGAIDVILPDRRLRLRRGPNVDARLAGLSDATRALDVTVLRDIILGPLLGLTSQDLAFTHDDDEAVAAVTSGGAHAAFLLNPPTIHQVEDVCLAGELMPEKSTYFFPKLASGLVFDLVGPPWV